jgi:ABC-type lipoprotein release transport system permease subunit
LTFQDLEYNIVAGAFRIKGIYESVNASFEEMNLYVNQNDLRSLMNLEGGVHEIAILLEESGDMEMIKDQLSRVYPELLVEGWNQISPELGIMIGSIDQYMIIFLFIILLALSFGIVNTMLMAVLERVREIGVLKSIGMNNLKVFSMIFLETVFIIAIATPIGLGLAYFSINYLGNVGIDISSFAKDAYAEFGIESIIYPKLQIQYYWKILIMVAITAVLASIYPSLTAIKLDPVKAIRKI